MGSVSISFYLYSSIKNA